MDNSRLKNMCQTSNLPYGRISEYYRQINPKEINDFISDMDGMVELINVLSKLIKKYFPNANTYLAFEEDLEEGDDCIYAYILNEGLSYEENDKLSDLMLIEYLELRDKYKDAWFSLQFKFDYGEEYYMGCMENPDDYNI